MLGACVVRVITGGRGFQLLALYGSLTFLGFAAGRILSVTHEAKSGRRGAT